MLKSVLNSKIKLLKKIGWYTKVLFATEYPRGMQYLKIAQTIYNDQCSI